MQFNSCKRALSIAILGSSTCAYSSPSLLSGFDAGLPGWQTIGDVSTQTAAVGLTPTQGTTLAFVTTLGASEIPYSGTPSPKDETAREFLGLPGGIPQFMAQMPAEPSTFPGGGTLEPPIVGEGGAMSYHFYAPQAGSLSFDWDRIGRDSDSAFLSLWSDDGTIRKNDWIYYATTYTGTFKSSGVDLCPHQTIGNCSDPAQIGLYDVETGWITKSLFISQPGWYTIGFGVGEVAEGTTPTVLALDNLQFSPNSVPEPATLALAVLALGGAALVSRRRGPRYLRCCVNDGGGL